MNLNESSIIDAFLTESCPVVFQALSVLPLKLTVSACQTEMSCVRRLDIFNLKKYIFFFYRGNLFSSLNIYLSRSQARWGPSLDSPSLVEQ